MAAQLGQKYRDTISGFEGTATGIYYYLNGCLRITLSAEKDGEPKDFTFDVQQLVDEDGQPADGVLAAESEKQVSRLNRFLRRERTEADAPKQRRGGPRTTPSRTGH